MRTWQLWERFALACGHSPRAMPRSRAAGPDADARRACSAWTAGEDLLEHLAVLYAIEAGQPEISTTKLEGLIAHYGFSDEGPATEYFRVHERATSSTRGRRAR